MDYRELLKKYMRHVVQSEGIDFTDRLHEFSDSVQFNEEEAAELKAISEELAITLGSD